VIRGVAACLARAADDLRMRGARKCKHNRYATTGNSIHGDDIAAQLQWNFLNLKTTEFYFNNFTT
jgi:hypothetical protein